MAGQVEISEELLSTRGPSPKKAKLSIVNRVRTSLGRKRIAPISGSEFSLLSPHLSSIQLLAAGDDASSSTSTSHTPDMITALERSQSGLLDDAPSSEYSSVIESLRQTLIVISASIVLCALHVVLGDWGLPSLPSCVSGTV